MPPAHNRKTAGSNPALSTYSRGINMMIKCMKCKTVLIMKKTLMGFRTCNCCNLMVDNTINDVFASEWKFIAVKKDNNYEWRNII
tara:strand:- start:854 stop:1108 length:255 start_codon:yes stop_codon:yes gene_type:complete